MAMHAEPILRRPARAMHVDNPAPESAEESRAAPASALQRALNESPRLAPQHELQRMLAEGPNAARQAQLAAVMTARAGASNGVAEQQVADPVQMRSRRQSAVGHSRLRTALMQTTSLTPVQRALSDWLPGLGTLASVAGTAYVGAKAGTAVGSLAGPLGATVGGVLGGLAGAAGSLYGAYRGGVTGAGAVGGLGGGAYTGAMLGARVGGLPGAAIGGVGGALIGGATGLIGGAAIQDIAPPRPRLRLASANVPSLGTVSHRRAGEMAMKATGGSRMSAMLRVLEFLDDRGLTDFMTSQAAEEWGKTQPKEVQEDSTLLIMRGIDHYYSKVAKTAAEPGAFAEDKKYAGTLSDVLEKSPFIDMILKGQLPRAEMAKKGGALTIPPNVPSEVRAASGTFNKLVARDVTPLPSAKRTISPESGIHRERGLQLGWASPEGAALHELGHHLEYNLRPSEFATLHNFLRARSASDRRRRVGYEAGFGGVQAETGYNIDLPNLGIGKVPSRTGFFGSAIGYPLSTGRAHEQMGSNIDRFIVAEANKPEGSYASQIYPISHDTEFLSTTIHFFTDPELALRLVRGDPLRVCLFLSFANPDVYEQVRQQFAIVAPEAPDLNRLIHKVTPG